MTTQNCKDLIDKFLHSSNGKLTLLFTHLGKPNLDNATGSYKGMNCEFNKSDLKYLDEYSNRYEKDTFYDTIYYDSLSSTDIPVKKIYRSK